MGQAVTFKGAADIPHCSGMERFGASTNVFVNSKGISREGDLNTSHLRPAKPVCKSHAAGIQSGSSKVRVNGRGCGRINDSTCTSVAQGSPNVFAG